MASTLDSDEWTTTFELQHLQFVEFQAEVRREFAEIRARLDGLTTRVDRLEAEVGTLRQDVQAFRDWATHEVSGLRRDMRDAAGGDE